MPKMSKVPMHDYENTNATPPCNFEMRTQLLTGFVANALAPGSKVQCFTYSQLSLMQVILVYISCSVDCLELIELLAVVCDITTQLQGHKQAN